MSQPDHVQLHRERYHPVVSVEVTIAHTANGRKTRTIAKQCAMHAILWNSLSSPQQDAANHVYRCYSVIDGESRMRAIDYSRKVEPRGSLLSAEFEQMLRADYFAWRAECIANGCDSQWAVDVCGEGLSISSITTNTQRQQLASNNLRQSLDVMAKMKGWK